MVNFQDIESLEDDATVVLSGKVMKELLSITRTLRVGPDRLHYVLGGRMTKAVCEAQPFDLKALVQNQK